jgi:hypothetical protein
MYGTAVIQFCAFLILALELSGKFHFTTRKSVCGTHWIEEPRTGLNVMKKRKVLAYPRDCLILYQNNFNLKKHIQKLITCVAKQDFMTPAYLYSAHISPLEWKLISQ